MTKKLETRIQALEQKATPEKRVIVAHEEMCQPGHFTISGDPKIYTEAEIHELAKPDDTLVFIVYYDKTPAKEAAASGQPC